MPAPPEIASPVDCGTGTAQVPGPRVVHVITTLVTGGAERQVQQLAASAAGGTVICLYGRGLVADAIESAGIPVVLLGADGLSRLTVLPRLARLLRQLDPDVVNVHLLSAQLWGIPAARLARVPVVLSTEHSLMDDSIEGRPHRWWLRLVYRALEAMSHHTVAVSATARRRLLEWGVAPGRISVIDNAVDLAGARFDADVRRRGREELGLPGGVSVIGAVGRLDPVKRFDVLLEALIPVLADLDAYVVIVGDGLARSQLEAQAKELGGADRVRFTGPRPDATSLLSCFDVFVSTSRDETFGIAVVEAVANGLPVVYAECPALDEAGGPPPGATRLGAGPDEVARLRRAVRAAAVEPRRAEPPGRLSRYSAERVTRAYSDLYTRLLSESRGR